MITPRDIKNHSFGSSLRGFNKEEVLAFLKTVALEWERKLEDEEKLKEKLVETKEDLEKIKKVEAMLHKTLLQAEESTKSMVESTKEKSELIIKEAEQKANEIIKDAISRRSKVEQEINLLISKRNDILTQLKSFLNSQTDRLEVFEEKEMVKIRKSEKNSEYNQELNTRKKIPIQNNQQNLKVKINEKLIEPVTKEEFLMKEIPKVKSETPKVEMPPKIEEKKPQSKKSFFDKVNQKSNKSILDDDILNSL